MNHAPPTQKADVEALPYKLRSSTAWQQWLRFVLPPLGSSGYDSFLNRLAAVATILPLNEPTVKPNYDSTTIRYRRPVSYRARTR